MTATKMPDWLRDQITIKTGAAPGSRNATAVVCPRCGAHVLRGHSDDLCAFTVTVDPQPLDTLGELLALASGRGTYALRRHLRHYRLHRRDRWQIRGQPPGSTSGPFRFDTVAEHRCGSPPMHTTLTVHQPDSTKEHHHDHQPPF